MAAIFCVVAFSNCASVKPYQRAKLNDREMQIEHNAAAQFEDYYQSIREGSTPPESGKTTDGCGCK
ncbi:MAG: DUF4266 domain-containing protein [Chitinophagales bacterium]